MTTAAPLEVLRRIRQARGAQVRSVPGSASGSTGASRSASDGASESAGASAEAGIERCEMCTVEIPAEHSHVVDLNDRNLMCACRPCWLLFPADRTTEQRYKAVPERYLSVPDIDFDRARWEELQIPVGVAFFFLNSALGHVAAFYPGPAGATESELPLESWARIVGDNPDLASLQPDVEAVLVRFEEGPSAVATDGKPAESYFPESFPEPEGESAPPPAAADARHPDPGGAAAPPDSVECFVVPIDVCYELVGRLRSSWRGFDGGGDARRELEGFFTRLRERARPARPARVAAQS